MKETIQIILGIIGGFLAIVSVPVVALYFLATSQPAQNEPAPQVVSRQTPNSESPTTGQIVSLINDEREKRNIGRLGVMPDLNTSARLKAEDLAKYEYLEHTNPYTNVRGSSFAFKLPEAGECTYVGENLARGGLTAKDTVSAWLESPSHKKILLEPSYDLTGVAIVNNYGSDGGYIVVQHFCDVE